MTHAAAFGLSAELRLALESACSSDSVGGLQVRIVDETFALCATLPAAASAGELSASVLPKLDGAGPCFFLLRLPSLGWALAAWVPDDAGVRERMLHSSGRAALRMAVNPLTPISFEAHWAAASEADVAALFEEPVGEAATMALLTATERLALADAKATAAESAGGKVSSAALAFPLTPRAADALAAFETGARDLLLLRIEGESVGLLPSPEAPPAAPAPLEALWPADGPCYALMRYPTEGSSALLFVYSCPESSAARAKMLHASCKGALLSSLAECGLRVAKTVEGEPCEHTHASVSAELAAAARAASAGGGGGAEGLGAEPRVVKTAPKGGRKLTRRR